jgi:hypothetical protein
MQEHCTSATAFAITGQTVLHRPRTLVLASRPVFMIPFPHPPQRRLRRAAPDCAVAPRNRVSGNPKKKSSMPPIVVAEDSLPQAVADSRGTGTFIGR